MMLMGYFIANQQTTFKRQVQRSVTTPGLPGGNGSWALGPIIQASLLAPYAYAPLSVAVLRASLGAYSRTPRRVHA